MRTGAAAASGGAVVAGGAVVVGAAGGRTVEGPAAVWAPRAPHEPVPGPRWLAQDRLHAFNHHPLVGVKGKREYNCTGIPILGAAEAVGAEVANWAVPVHAAAPPRQSPQGTLFCCNQSLICLVNKWKSPEGWESLTFLRRTADASVGATEARRAGLATAAAPARARPVRTEDCRIGCAIRRTKIQCRSLSTSNAIGIPGRGRGRGSVEVGGFRGRGGPVEGGEGEGLRRVAAGVVVDVPAPLGLGEVALIRVAVAWSLASRPDALHSGHKKGTCIAALSFGWRGDLAIGLLEIAVVRIAVA